MQAAALAGLGQTDAVRYRRRFERSALAIAARPMLTVMAPMMAGTHPHIAGQHGEAALLAVVEALVERLGGVARRLSSS